MLGDIDPPHLTCSTRLIREFLGLGASSARAFRVILFRRLPEIRYLGENDLVIAFLDCLFCECLRGLCYVITLTMLQATGLWEKYIEHGNISIGNLMCDPVTERGALNDQDLARDAGPNGKPSAKDNIGTMPFLALDLLNKATFDGQVQRRHRHDVESFVWCLIYICVCVGKDGEGRIRTVNPHPLLSWFWHVDTSYCAKWQSVELNSVPPLHERTRPLAKALHTHWATRYIPQRIASRQDVGDREPHVLANTPAKWLVAPKTGHIEARERYEEPSDGKSFVEMVLVVVRASAVIPPSLVQVFLIYHIPSYIQPLAIRWLVFEKAPAGFYIRLWSLACTNDGPSVGVPYS